jgi:glycosyltransferase involved in cell wall biosynthesis
MKRKPLISVVMNCYNGERYLKESLDSIKNQKFKNWELIFWDNRSTDNSKRIFSSLKDKRFKYYYANQFTNLYAARNLAIKKTRGKIITFIDVDDIWLPHKLEKQVEYFLKNKSAEIVYSNYFIQKKILGFNLKKIKFKSPLPHGYITKDLLINYCIGWLTVAIKKNIINKKKKFFNEKINMVADYDLMINLSLRYKIHCIQSPMAIYRQHPNQLTRLNFISQADHFLKWSKTFKLKKLISDYKHLKNLNYKIEFFKEIKLINKGKYSFIRIYKKLLNGKIKLVLKIIIYLLFPSLFTKYILSI